MKTPKRLGHWRVRMDGSERGKGEAWLDGEKFPTHSVRSMTFTLEAGEFPSVTVVYAASSVDVEVDDE